jgi:methylmalonyl-CoA/ethylmalonyl-CoA epimerase
MAEVRLDPTQTFTRLAQIGFVVRDIEKSAKFLSEVFGIGPFRVIDYPPEGRDDIIRYYHGKPANFSARLAFAGVGQIELELIQPLGGDNIWDDFLEQHGEGIHHIRFNVADIEQTTEYLAQHDVAVLQMGSGLRPGTFFKYFDTEEKVGFIIEALNQLPGTDGRAPAIQDGHVQP